MKELTIEEKTEIAAALHNRVDFLKKTIATLKTMELMQHILRNLYPYVKLLLMKTKYGSVFIKKRKYGLVFMR